MDIESCCYPVKISWGKKKIDMELDTACDMDTFRAQLYSMTLVPPAKQKILFKGKTLKNDTVISQLKISKGSLFMLMGSAEGEGLDLKKIQEKKVFIEDMTLAEKAIY